MRCDLLFLWLILPWFMNKYHYHFPASQLLFTFQKLHKKFLAGSLRININDIDGLSFVQNWN